MSHPKTTDDHKYNFKTDVPGNPKFSEARTEFEYEPMTESSKGARIWVTVRVDGEQHRYILMSGPRKDVKEYFDGTISLDEIRERWGMADGDKLQNPKAYE